MIEFWRTTDEYGCFSNFSKHTVEIDGLVWPTTEHYYQAMKHTDESLKERIRQIKSCKVAKTLAYSAPAREDWEQIKFDVMRKAIRAKADQHPEIKAKLLETGDDPLAEASPFDYVWGTGKDGTGQNWLGKLWVELRESLTNQKRD